MKILVHDAGKITDVTEAVQIVYDALHSSLDFGSGMLDTPEMKAMRDLAVVAGFENPKYGEDMCVCGHKRDLHWTRDESCRHKVTIRERTFDQIIGDNPATGRRDWITVEVDPGEYETCPCEKFDWVGEQPEPEDETS